MVEEIVKLVQALDGLTWAALTAIGMIFLYKVTVVGSIYGVIRYSVSKIHEFMMARESRHDRIKSRNEAWSKISSLFIGFESSENDDELLKFFLALRDKYSGGYSHISRHDVARARMDLEKIGDTEKQ